ncbi:MAG: DUF6538 domain-containing protein [Prosthecobacter sp.]|uniref:DUF6538 domain-containing protein n=1 Tax=Prosthecobacter sp. TaxID=1965333 RepID=UPI0038FFD6A2
MPRQQGLLRRGSRWYSNFKVPPALRDAFGKEHIRETLGTSDYREAVRKIASERHRWTLIFESARSKLAPSKPHPAPPQPSAAAKSKRLMTAISDREAFEYATRYLVLNEREFRGWMDSEGRLLDEVKQGDILSDIVQDRIALAEGDEFRGEPLDGTFELQSFLETEGIDCPATSPAFQKLRPLVMAAHLEHLGRCQDMLKGIPAKERDNLFRGIHSHSPAMEKPKGKTLAELIHTKELYNVDVERSVKTVSAFKLPARLLLEVLGEDKPIESISREDMGQVFSLMKDVPLNAQQRYPGMTLKQAIEAARLANDQRKPVHNTLAEHYLHISALFKYAVGEGLMSKNPAATPTFQGMFRKEDVEPREQFTIDELNRLFHAPLYTGCVNDGAGYAKPGPERPRRGRFWVPLLALYHGTRCNEACQIYTADVKTADEIVYIAIREEAEDGGPSIKKLKTKQSIRNVPVHPELIRMGFLDFVEARKRDAESPRLFPELTPGHKGYCSDAFSKWFGRFKHRVLGEECEATMHSFRHQFRDATRAARLPDESVGRLAGWEHGWGIAKLQMHQYGRGKDYLRILAEDLAKVQYPGLDLSHLYPASAAMPKRPLHRLREG